MKRFIHYYLSLPIYLPIYGGDETPFTTTTSQEEEEGGMEGFGGTQGSYEITHRGSKSGDSYRNANLR